jgi:hypothetical protein
MYIAFAFVVLIAFAQGTPNVFENQQKMVSEILQHAHKTVAALKQPVVQVQQQAQQNQNHFSLQLSTNCQNAYNAYTALSISCAFSVLGLLVPPVSQTQMNNYCGANSCNANLTASVTAVINACNASELASQGFSIANSNPSNYFCTSYNNQYCWPAFYNSFSSINGTFTSSVLDSLCSTCTQMLVANIQSNVSNSFSTACLKSNGQYCLLYFQSVATSPPTTVSSIYTAYCENKCMQLYIETSSPNVDSGNFFQYFCAINPSNSQSCLTAANTIASNPSFGCQTTASCSAACATSLSSAYSTLGCCSATLLSLVSFGDPLHLSGSAALNFSTNQCNLMVPAVCNNTKSVNLTLTISNLRYSYYQSNPNIVGASVIADVAFAAVTGPNNIAIVSATSFNSSGVVGIQFVVSISAATSSQASTLQTYVSGKITAGTFSLTHVNSLPATSYYTVANASSVDAQASTVTGANSASGLSVMLALTILSILVNFISFF